MSTRTAPSRLRAATGATAVAAVSAAGLVLGSGTAAAAATTVPVYNADLAADCAGAQFCTFLRDGGTAASVEDPNAILGDASLRLSTPLNNDKATVFSNQFFGQPLSDITELQYQTFIDTYADRETNAPALNIGINPNEAGSTFTTLVWEPVYTRTSGSENPVLEDTTQTWTPSDGVEGRGGWWATGTDLVTGTENTYGFDTYTATFDEVKAALPDATILQVGVNQGSGNPGLTSLVDGLTVNDTVYDFEVAAPPLPPAQGRADLAAVVTAPPFSDRGTDVPVEVTVTNRGQNPSGPTTATAITPGYAVSAADGTVNANGSVTLAVPYLAPGASATFSITADGVDGFRLGFAGVFVAPAAGQPDPNLFNNIGLALAVTR